MVICAKPTLDGNDIEGVEGINVDKNANIIPLSIPTLDSDATEVFDALGVLKIITIRGEWKGSVTTIKGYVDIFEAIVDGDQTVISFVSDQTDTISCMVASITTDWNSPGTICSFNMKLIQGSV